MLKEAPRYDYVEETAEISEPAWRSLRRRKPHVPSLPVGLRQMQHASSIPLQSYLQARFPHLGSKDYSARTLRAENQRRHDLATARGNWRPARASGDWHPITAAEIACALASLAASQNSHTTAKVAQ